MKTLSYRTKSATPEIVKRQWWIIDAESQVVGRVASKIASLLKGKNKPYYSHHVDCGDYVIVINADKVRFTGNKLIEKEYKDYSGYPGGQKIHTPKTLLQKKPENIIERAVKGMIPKTKLGRGMTKRLFAYAGPEHPHAMQKPQSIKL